MSLDYRKESPGILKDFLIYHESVRGHSKSTVDEYFLDLRTFFRYLKIIRGIYPDGTDLDDIPIDDVDLDFVSAVNINEVHEYLTFLSRDRVRNHKSRNAEYGLSSASKARKVASIKSFYSYLTQKVKLLDVNPVRDLDAPKLQKTLPRYLNIDECRMLLNSIDGKNRERDYCIICIFLNCGLRISEIVGLDIGDIRTDHLRVMGKGGKERIVYLNDACIEAIDDYMRVRNGRTAIDENAFFLSNRRKRMSRETVHSMVKKSLLKAGIDNNGLSAHKLRHTAATLMLQNGVDVRTLQEVLGHDHLNTTQIYTHVDSSELRGAASANPLAGFEHKKDKK